MPSGRTIVIGDVHGCHIALELLLDAIDPQEDDCIIFLGDIIDRGPGSRQCIDMILVLRQHCRVVHLMGNHEEMFLDALTDGPWAQSWYEHGGAEMLASYGNDFANIPATHLDFIRGGKDFFETRHEIYVHGNVRPNVPVDLEQAHWLRWTRFHWTDRFHGSGKRVICGHTAQWNGRPAGTDQYLCLDTCAYGRHGALSALDVDMNLIWQATQSGEVRPARPLSEIVVSDPDEYTH